MSLQQVAQSTKVSIGMLQALERDDASRLPGGVFARGFVQSYAAAVGLDPAVTLAEFVEQSPLGSVKDGYPPATRVEKIERPQGQQVAIRIHPRKGLAVARLAVVVALVVGLAAYLATTKRWPWAVSHSSAQAAQPSLIDSGVVTTPPDITPQASPVGDASEPAGTLPDPVAAPKPAPVNFEPGPSAGPAAPAETPAGATARAAVDPSIDAGAAAPPVPDPPAVKSLDVVLSATNPSWVIVTLDGQKILSRMFEVGDKELLEVRRELIVTAADAAAIVMTLNGAPARALGASHQTVTAHIDRTNYRTYLRPDGPSPDTP